MSATARLEILELQAVGGGRYRVANEGDPATHDVAFGGQLLGQLIAAAAAATPGKQVRTIQCIFARAARVSAATEIALEPMHDGRSFGSTTATVWQGDRLCARALVLLDAGDPDTIRHALQPPETTGPEDAAVIGPAGLVFPGAEYRVVGGVDTWDPAAPTGPAELNVWMRCAGAPDDVTANQAILAWGSDGFLIGTALRPHTGVGQDQAHRTLATGVVSHTLTFHERFTTAEWLLLAHSCPHAGGGRSYGRAHVFARDGRLVASYVQDNMIRAMAGA